MPESTAPASPGMTFTPEQFRELLAAVAGNQEDKIALIKLQAEETAKANKKLIRPENEQAPGISVFSRPEGELKNPKGALKCKMTWAGAPVDLDVTTADEFDELQKIEPGTYTCTRSDGTKFPVEVEGTRDATTGGWRQIDIRFATRGTLKHNLPPQLVMLREMNAQRAQTA